MNNRERILGVLNYQPVDRLPVLHFGFLYETLRNWQQEGHLTEEEVRGYGDGNLVDEQISKKLGFDCNYHTLFAPHGGLLPGFEYKVVKEFPDGRKHIMTGDGIVVLHVPGAGSIQPDVDHLLKDRAAWEQLYRPKLRFSEQRITNSVIRVKDAMVAFKDGADEFLRSGKREHAIGLHCGSLYGTIRNWLTLEGACYLLVDDEPLLDEIIETNAELQYECTKAALATGAKFDFAHFWEDICFKNGPLISPSVFQKKIGPHYRRITEMVNRYGINIVSLDCDGLIDALIPTWFQNGVNTMFPIEVGTWGSNVAPWRAKYGRELRGVGGMAKRKFAYDFAAIDAEIERLKPLVELGGYLPCPDHRIANDARWDNVRYYCDRMRKVFG